ncbi:transglutaminase-like domain-containing protein, partial [Endozoicomonas sp. SESOKO2]
IRRSHLNSIDEKRHEIRIKADPDGEKARTEIISRVAQARWQASGLSLKPDPSDDTLTRALYRYWQQSWFDREYGQTGVDANCVFPLTEEEKQTLELSPSQPYLREVDQRISAWNSNAVRLWPAFWHQISDVQNHWVEGSEQYIPMVHGKERNTLDRRTNFEHRAIPDVKDYKVFNTQDFPSAMYRWRAKDIDVTAEGEIKLTEMADQHIQGYDVLIPDPLPEHAREMTLASGTLATLCMSSHNGLYALPSLTPDDYIVALSIKPDLPFILTRDVYTGLHTLTLRRAGDIRSIQCAYVVEPREPDRIIPFREACSEQSTRSDTRCSEGMKAVLDELFETISDQHPTEIHPPEIKALLLTIKNTDDTMQRIEAIKHYCKLFTGETAPEDGVNFFKFLVTQRQGSCRHRVPVFVAFCRYFGIPCRQIQSFIHAFAEYSADGGQTWESVDLGGAPAPLIAITHDFLPTRNVGGFSNVSKNINALLKDLLKDADSAQQHALAEACGMSLEQLNKALDRNSAWPATNLRITNIINNLWERKDLTGLSMGVSLIQSLETKALGEEEMALISPVYSSYCKPAPMPEAVKQILAVSDEDQVTELLKSLYSKMIDQAGASPHLWLSSILRILQQDSDLAKSSFIHFAREAMESGWLDPLPTYENNGMLNCALHGLLVSLEAVDELKVKAAHCLKKWYRVLLSREKSRRIWRLAYESFQMKEGETLFVTHCHDGFSPSLEDKIKRSSIQAAWTDQPEGIPNIERMLVHYPAFKQLTSGKANHRPVIIMGKPFWYKGVIHEKTEALFQLSVEKNFDLTYLMEKSNQYDAKYEEYIHALRICEIRTLLDRTNSLPGYVKSLPPHQRSRFQKEEQKNENDIKNEYGPILDRLELSHEEQKLFRDLKDICKRAIRQAFAHYLYEVTHSKGGCLTYCWVGASIEAHDTVRDRCGAYDPSSPEELYAMMSAIDNPDAFQTSVNNAYLREAFNASNALVLKSDELTEIAIEFSSSVNLNSICNSLYAGLMQ